MPRFAFALLAIVSLIAPAAAQRVELPVKLVVVHGGVRRYAVMVTVNGQPVEAGLDTGSSGLRILAPALPGGAGLSGPTTHYGYGSGVRFEGPAVKAAVGFGAAPAREVLVQRIDKLGCNAAKPDCAGKDADLARFSIMGDGIEGEGFPAILGIGMHDDLVANPLVQLGISRWIVELPRAPGETGRLVLNPTDDETSRYKAIGFIAGTNQVVGCVTSKATKLCAPTMVDSGASGIRVQGGKPADILPQGTAAMLVIGDGKAEASLPVTIGRRDQAAGMRLYPARADAKLSLSFGIAPYLRWSILYDARAKTLALADRWPPRPPPAHRGVRLRTSQPPACRGERRRGAFFDQDHLSISAARSTAGLYAPVFP